MGHSSRWRWIILVLVLLISSLTSSIWAQGLQQSPYSAPNVLRGGGLDLDPSNPLGMPTGVGLRGSDSIYLNSGMFRDLLPLIPNLEVGYLYQFGNRHRTGRLSLDYVLPATVWDDRVIFAEAHGEFTNFWKTLQRLFRSETSRFVGSVPYTGTETRTDRGYPDRIDLSFGGGYRKLLSENQNHRKA